MHCESMMVALGTAAVVLPAYLAFRLHSILMIGKEASPSEDGVPGVVSSPVKASLAERIVDKAFAMRDQRLCDVLKDILPVGGRVCDVGCGDGSLLEKLKEQGFDVHGIDVDINRVTEARRKIGDDRIKRGDFVAMWQTESRIDAVLLCDSIRYMTRPQTVLLHALRVGRRVLITEPLEIWHFVGRIVFLRFLHRAGHLSSVDMRRLPVIAFHRTPFHRIWVLDGDASSEEIQALEDAVAVESREVTAKLVHPGIDRRLRRVFYVTSGAAVLALLTLVAYLSLCWGSRHPC